MSEEYNNPIIELQDKLSDRPVTSSEAMQAIVRADGNLDLAAVRLNSKKANVLAAIVTDPNNHDTLGRYFRAHQTIRAFELIGTISDYLEPKLEELSARDLAKTYIAMLEVMNKFTEPPANSNNNQGNHMENMLKMLPPHVQDAIRNLAQADSESAEAGA